MHQALPVFCLKMEYIYLRKYKIHVSHLVSALCPHLILYNMSELSSLIQVAYTQNETSKCTHVFKYVIKIKECCFGQPMGLGDVSLWLVLAYSV